MKNKTFIVVLFVLVLLSLNFSVAHEMDNATDKYSNSSSDFSLLSASDVNQSVLKDNSKLDTQIDVVSNTTFDVKGDYFKIKLTDENGSSIANSKVTFSVLSKDYSRTTDGKGMASLQINLKDGSYNITTRFLGNSKYKPSSNTTTITVENTRIVDSGLSNSEIQKIIDNAKDGNVILFNGKSYSNVNLIINKRLTLISNSNTVLKSSSSSPVITIKGKTASNTIIKGFNIQGKGNGITVTNSDFIRIIKNDITTGSNGIVATGTKYLNITNNNIVKNSKSGIVIGNSTSTYIFNNKLSNNEANAIEVAKTNNVYVHGNTIYGNTKNGVVLTKTVNGINYGEGPKNVYIDKNTISKNHGDGVIAYNAGDNLNIRSNFITANRGNGISLANVGNNVIQSNEIAENWENGIQFFDNYIEPFSQDISYNALYSNLHMDVEARDTYYKDYGTRLEVGQNWYTDYPGICPKIKTSYIQFSVKQIGPNQYQALFTDSSGDVADLLPDRVLTYRTNNGEKKTITVSGGAAVFTVDANDGDIIKSIVDNSRRDNTNKLDSQISQPINGVSPSYTYPEIPYGNGNGNGNGEGSGNGSGTGNNGVNNQGNRNNQNQNSEHDGNSTTYQSQNAGKSSTPMDNPQNDAANSASSESASTSGGVAGAESQSVVKQIIIDEDEFFRVTGMSFIVLLIILTIAFYYRDDIKEMNSKR